MLFEAAAGADPVTHEPSALYDVDAVIVGASWAGIWALYKLKQQGLRVSLIECQPGVGGVWYYTRYPGCRVDTEIPFYEYAAPELWQDWNWTERFASRSEIHGYIETACDKLDLWRHIILNTRVSSCIWDECTKQWNLFTKAGLHTRAQFFLPCTGYSTVMHSPRFKGAGSFENAFHTAQWPENLDIEGKRVGVVGTGASGIQVIEAVGQKASHLTVFQRTPNLAVPARQVSYTHEEIQEVKKDFPRLFEERLSTFGVDSSGRRPRTFDDTAEERQAFYEELYQKGGLSFWFRNYSDLLTDKAANQEAYTFWRSKTISRIHDPQTADKLAPLKAPHAFGTKRPSLETAYFEIFNQPNVTLVDVNEDPIIEENSDGILTLSGLHKLDVLIYATGFDFLTASMLKMGIKGIGGCDLSEKWQVDAGGSGVWTYLGLMSGGFPNMFFPVGPQAPTALGLTPLMSEIEGGWVSDCIRHLKEQGMTTIEPGEALEKWWKGEVVRASEETLFSETDSWYMGVNIPGRRKEARCYFGGIDKYAKKLEECAEGGYKGCIFG